MYIDKDSCGKFQLLDMTIDELKALARMIKGASLEERRTFNKVLREISL